MVSHNMQAVTRLCSRCILLHDGKIKLEGPSAQVSNAYLNSGIVTTAAREWPDLDKAPGDEVARLCAVRVISKDGSVAETVDIRNPVGIELEYEVQAAGHVLRPFFDLTNESGIKLFVSIDVDPTWKGRERPLGRYLSTGWIPGNLLAEGMITVAPGVMTLNPERIRTDITDAVAFRVVDSMSAQDTARGEYTRQMPGVLRPMLQWSTRPLATPVSGGRT